MKRNGWWYLSSGEREQWKIRFHREDYEFELRLIEFRFL